MTKAVTIKGREITVQEGMKTVRVWGSVEGLRPGDLATIETYDVSGDEAVMVSTERVTLTEQSVDFWARAIGVR